MKRILQSALVVALMLPSAWASAALLRITPLGVASDEQAVTDPVPIGGDGFRLTYHSQGGGNDPIINELFLIFGTPFGEDEPVVTDGAAQNPANLDADLGVMTWRGTWDGTGANNVYDYLGITPVGAGNSQNYTNWTGGAADYGMSISSWNIYTLGITFTPQFSPSYWNEFLAEMVAGTYVVGWGCESIGTSGPREGTCRDAQATPFTFAGLVTPPNRVPEPGSLALLGAGLLGLGFLRRRAAA